MKRNCYNIIIVGATHGHETLGVHVWEQLPRTSRVRQHARFLVGNPRAYEKRCQFIDADLNRIFPGDANSTLYEEHRAAELVPQLRDATVIDIHATGTIDNPHEEAMAITVRDDMQTRALVRAACPPRALLMRYRAAGALIAHARCGIALEYGKSDDKAAQDMVRTAVERIVASLCAQNHNDTADAEKSAAQCEYVPLYEVYDVVTRPPGEWVIAPTVHNWVCVHKGDTIAQCTKTGNVLRAKEDFIPILFGENRYTTIFGFCARPTMENV